MRSARRNKLMNSTSVFSFHVMYTCPDITARLSSRVSASSTIHSLFCRTTLPYIYFPSFLHHPSQSVPKQHPALYHPLPLASPVPVDPTGASSP